MQAKVLSFIRLAATALLVSFASLGGIHWLEHFGISSLLSSMLVVAFFLGLVLWTRQSAPARFKDLLQGGS